MKRLEKSGDSYYAKGREEEGYFPKKDYNDCNSGQTLGISSPTTGIRQVIQLCDLEKVSLFIDCDNMSKIG